MSFDQTPFVVRMAAGPGGSGRQRMFTALSDVLSSVITLPATLQELQAELPLRRGGQGTAAGGFWMQLYEVPRVVTVFEADGETVRASWDRGLHWNVVFWAVEPRTREEIVQILNEAKADSQARSVITGDVDHDTPSEMMTEFGLSAQRKVRHHIATGVRFFWGDGVQHPAVMMAGEKAF